MTTYRIKISADKWPTEFTVQASGWHTAISRAIKEWRKKAGKGSRTQELSIKAIKVGELLIAED
jgi:hypothetical protein